jgi:hypothetical protein
MTNEQELAELRGRLADLEAAVAFLLEERDGPGDLNEQTERMVARFREERQRSGT